MSKPISRMPSDHTSFECASLCDLFNPEEVPSFRKMFPGQPPREYCSECRAGLTVEAEKEAEREEARNRLNQQNVLLDSDIQEIFKKLSRRPSKPYKIVCFASNGKLYHTGYSYNVACHWYLCDSPMYVAAGCPDPKDRHQVPPEGFIEFRSKLP